jgi:hypothetical protein
LQVFPKACPVREDAHDEEQMVQFLKVNGIYDDVRHFMFAMKGAFKEVQHHEPGAKWVENLFHIFPGRGGEIYEEVYRQVGHKDGRCFLRALGSQPSDVTRARRTG